MAYSRVTFILFFLEKVATPIIQIMMAISEHLDMVYYYFLS